MIATPGESSKSGAAGNVQAPLGVAGAIRDGAGRVNRAPAVLLGMLVVTLI
ncbi:MAG: hypothetical protein HYX76_14635, partial [Acidobacteria bacterium]|nr:hypothetical protein [Acidobacteriota bacterium]